jgi:predicted AAA+ superfamily ATPase
MTENERSTAINPGETVEEKVSLSDRFGLWLGFHRCSQDEYLAMVEGCRPFQDPGWADDLRREALNGPRRAARARPRGGNTCRTGGTLGVRLSG